MLTKIKFFSFVVIFTLITQTNVFGMVPHTGKPLEQSQHFNLFLIFQQLISTKKPDDLHEELLTDLRSLKEKNSKEELITDIDVNHIKQLWDQFKSLHNHNWLDCIINPFRKMITPETIIQNRNKKPLSTLLHSDPYSRQNKKQMDSLFIHLGDASRPEKATDPLICAASDMIIIQGIPLIISLANKICPQLFKNRSFEQFILKKETCFNIFRKNEIDPYKSAIKTKEETINYKRLAIKNLIDNYGTKKQT